MGRRRLIGDPPSNDMHTGGSMNAKIFTVCCLLIALSGCASGNVNLARATAMSVGHNVAPEAVAISNVHRGAMSVRWLATTPKGHYSCSADDMVRRPYCVKQ